jgi:hypothetical protein
MAIPVKCQTCGYTTNAVDSESGKIVRCPKCKNLLSVSDINWSPPDLGSKGPPPFTPELVETSEAPVAEKQRKTTGWPPIVAAILAGAICGYYLRGDLIVSTPDSVLFLGNRWHLDHSILGTDQPVYVCDWPGVFLNVSWHDDGTVASITMRCKDQQSGRWVLNGPSIMFNRGMIHMLMHSNDQASHQAFVPLPPE